MRISRKLVVSMAGLAILSVGVTATAALTLFVKQIDLLHEKQITLAADARKQELQQLLSGIQLDVEGLARNPQTREVLVALNEGFDALGDKAMTTLQTRYIEANPNPAGKRQDLANPGVDSYDNAHEQAHAFLRKHQEHAGYYDIFLVNLKGDIAYSVFKESDFANNVKDGALKDSGLGAVFAKAEAGTHDAIHFVDFAPYGPSAGAPAAFLGIPVTDKAEGGKPIGILAVQMPAERIASVFANRNGLGDTGHVVLVNKQKLALSDLPVTPANDIMTVAFDNEALSAALGGMKKNTEDPAYLGRLHHVSAVPVGFLGTRWAVMTAIDDAEVSAPRQILLLTGIGIGAIIVLLGIAAAWALSRSITRPISRIIGEMQRLRDGDTTIEVADAGRTDEVGDIGRSLIAFRDAAIDKERLERDSAEQRRILAEQDARIAAERARTEADQAQALEALSEALERLAVGNLETGVTENLPRDFAAMGVNYNIAMQALAATLSQVRSTADTISDAGRKLSHSSESLAQRTVEQAASLEESSTALKAIITTIIDTAEKAKDAATTVTTTRDQAMRSGDVVRKAVNAMEAIKDSSTKISSIISVIDQIAFQTNLLALNAGVEAARAGDAGRGFAVVAQEVRDLAVRCSKAASEIATLISQSGDQVKHGVGLVEETGDAILDIIERINATHRIVEAIAVSTGDQTAGLGQISTAVEQMEALTNQNSAMVQANSQELADLQERIAALADRLAMFRTRAAETDEDYEGIERRGTASASRAQAA